MLILGSVFLFSGPTLYKTIKRNCSYWTTFYSRNRFPSTFLFQNICFFPKRAVYKLLILIINKDASTLAQEHFQISRSKLYNEWKAALMPFFPKHLKAILCLSTRPQKTNTFHFQKMSAYFIKWRNRYPKYVTEFDNLSSEHRVPRQPNNLRNWIIIKITVSGSTLVMAIPFRRTIHERVLSMLWFSDLCFCFYFRSRRSI